MDFRQFQYIIAVADNKSVTKAANALFMSQPALSHFIQKTETDLGVVLLDRSTNPISLTYAGEKYVETGREILRLNDKLVKNLADISGNQTGRIKLGIPRDRASYMLPLLLTKFAEKYPNVDVKPFTAGGNELKDLLLKGRIDFIIIPFFGKDSNVVAQKIYEEELLLVAPKGMIKPHHLLEGTDNFVDITKISDLPMLFLPEGRGNSIALQVLFKYFKVKPKIVEEYDSNITLVRMAAAGRGITIVPRMITELTVMDENSEIFYIGNPPITWEVEAVYRKDAYISKAEKDLIALATQLFSNNTKTIIREE